MAEQLLCVSLRDAVFKQHGGVGVAQVLRDMYDPAVPVTEYYAAMDAYYQAGVRGEGAASVTDSGILSSQQQEAAYLAGLADGANGTVAKNAAAEYTVDTRNGGNASEETGAGHFRGQRRTPGVAADGQGTGVEARAGSSEAGGSGSDQAQRAAGRRNRAEAAGVVSQSTRAQGVAAGTDSKTMKVLPSRLWDEDIRAVVREKAKEGIQVVPFIGQLEARDAGGVFKANGWMSRDGKRMLVRADHDTLTMRQLADHEEYHAKAGLDKQLDRRLKKELARKYGRGWEKFLANAYAEMYFSGQDLTRELEDYILQEILADAYAGIDVLRGVENVPMRATDISAQVRETADKVKARGPPVGRDANVLSNGQERFSYAGRNAKGADIGTLSEAQEMQKQGASAETILHKTGWFVGADGKWRFEIDDSKMSITKEYLLLTDGKYLLRDIVSHDALFEAYPQIGDTKVVVGYLNSEQKGIAGVYKSDSDTIILNRAIYLPDAALLDLLVHELQHKIQRIEGFARGASPEYWRKRGIGEAEYSRFKESVTRQIEKEMRKLSEADRADLRRYFVLDEELSAVLSGFDFSDLERSENILNRAELIEKEHDGLYARLYDKEWFSKIVDMKNQLDVTDDLYTVFYKNTAGEIEARDVSARRTLTEEQRRSSMPNIGDENTVFADSGDGYFAMSADEQVGIREQLRENSDRLNNMEVVGRVNTQEYAGLDTRRAREKLVAEMKKTGYKVDRQGFGEIRFEESEINNSLNYKEKDPSAEDARRTGFLVLQNVLKRGIEIDGHDDHKGRNYDTVTIAAPVEINGKRGNMAVVVKRTKGNRYKVHRILTPEGGAFTLPEMANAEVNTVGAFTNDSQSLRGSAPAINSASIYSITENAPSVKGRFSREGSLTQEQVDRLTSYNALVNRPDMTVTEIDDTARYTANSQTRKALVRQAIKNAAAIGKTDSSGGVSVHVDDIGRDVLMSKHGLQHGLDRRLQDNAAVTLDAGSILKNAVLINKLTPQNQNASDSYVLLGAARNKDGVLSVVEFVVNSFSNEVTSVDVLYSANAKKEPAVLNAPAIANHSLRITGSTISIARLLDFARDHFPDVLPESVLRHYGFAERPGGRLGESALFSREADLTDPELQARLTKLLEEYGAIKPGENPFRNVNIPQQTEKENRVSQTVRTILEAKATPDEVVPTVEQMVADGEFSYRPYSDKQAVADARAKIEKDGWAASTHEWFDRMKQGSIGKANTTMGWLLYDNAANSGDTALAMDILNRMVESQRDAAQALQATRILKQLSPEAQLYGVQRSVDSLQEEISERYGDNAPDLRISEELAEKFLKARSDHTRAEALKDIYRDIGRQMPSRFMDKFNAWRYIAMLANPRTHVRNIVGNAGFAPVVAVKDTAAAFIEGVVLRRKGGRTKAFGLRTKTGRALIRAAWADYTNVKQEMPDGKYSDLKNANRYIEEGRQIFGRTQDARTRVGRAISGTLGRAVEKVRLANSRALTVEDQWFAQPHYAAAMAQYCLANGITAEEIASGKGQRIRDARAYAMKEAQKATYQDTNDFSSWFSNIARTSNPKGTARVVSYLSEGVLPFRKTPANILVRGVEYSPIGLLNGVKKALLDVQSGRATAAEAIDSIAAGLTGTALVGLGIWMASLGLVRGHGDDEKDKEKKFKQLQGVQYYALELPDGTSATLDWLAPEALPFFVGVNLYESTSGMEEAPKMADLLGALTNTTEPLLEMSCLQGLNDIIESVGYASSNGLAGIPQMAVSSATSLLTQLVPTFFGQVERSGEPTRMTTYTDKNKWIDTDMQYFLGKLSAKIPGLDYSQIPYIDEWGRTEYNGGPFERIANNMLNPAYMSEVSTSETEEELQRLYDATGDGGVLPGRAAKYFTVDGERIDLTAEQYRRNKNSTMAAR